jgi:pilus assembly protein Flp/PilA
VAGPKPKQKLGPFYATTLEEHEMTRLRGFFTRLRKDEKGATMIEYSILIGIITAVAIGFIIAMGGFVSGAWSLLCSNINASGSSIGCNVGG